jgi:predicted DNA binding protein
MGKYEPVTGATDLPVELTERQREMLDTAVRLGYYETPRRTTHRGIAAELDLSVGTVTEHFQRVEASVIGDCVR